MVSALAGESVETSLDCKLNPLVHGIHVVSSRPCGIEHQLHEHQQAILHCLVVSSALDSARFQQLAEVPSQHLQYLL